MRLTIPVLAILSLSLAACGDAPQSTAPTGGAMPVMQDVPGLTPGMTREEAAAAMGGEAGFENDIMQAGLTCVSYLTGATYAHGIFRDGTLERASGGHMMPCTFDPSI
ncbi:hypothetical protein [Litorisediminicola beolgyonensis]|uniref:Uncharacterized protein n=1 Tax=Litorisediminicola beolgyonensis TaxID=1173614 RepID=A0ABW3ZKI1_9RHOB